MKKYRRYINSSKYLDENRSNFLFDDYISIEIEINAEKLIAATTLVDFKKFPGREQFRKDVINILEKEYGFTVIEDIYNGILQKGYFSNRSDSLSLYMDTYFDLSNSEKVLSRLGIDGDHLTEGKVFCFIHFRFSDHAVYNVGDVSHNQFLRNNAERFIRNNPSVTHVIKEESIQINEGLLQQYYDDALDDLRYLLDSRIGLWARNIKRGSYRR